MTVSPDRTIVIPAKQAAYGILPMAPRWSWDVAEPEDSLDYGLDITAPLADVSDTIVAFVASVYPWGEGELTLSAPQLDGNVIGLTAAGGMAGRPYVVRIQVATTAGRRLTWRIGLPIDASAGPLPPAPVNSGFGSAINWPANGPSIDFTDDFNSDF